MFTTKITKDLQYRAWRGLPYAYKISFLQLTNRKLAIVAELVISLTDKNLMVRSRLYKFV